MSESIFNNIRIVGVSAAVPDQVRDRVNDSVVLGLMRSRKFLKVRAFFSAMSATLYVRVICVVPRQRGFLRRQALTGRVSMR